MAPNAIRQVPGTEQVLPTWLTYSPMVGPSGTSYTILRLPLTYYGPSIPLGTDGTWTYGGLSSPPPSATASITPTSTAPPVTTSPPTTTFSSSTLPSSTSLSSTSSRPTTTTFASVSVITRTRTSTASTAPTSTSTAAPGGSPLPPVAIALIALGAAAVVLLCCLIGALLWRRRKSRRDREPPRGDSEFYAGPGTDDGAESIHAVPNLTGERHSLLGNDSFIVVPGRSPRMTQRSFNGVSYQRLGESRAPSHSSRRTGSDEIGVAYTDMPPPRTRRRTVTAVSNAVSSSSPSHPTSSSRPGIGSMRSHNESQRSSLFERPAEQDESPVLPRESAHGVIKRASDLGDQPLQAPARTAQPSGSQYGQGPTLGAELGILGLGTRYPDPSQSLLATSSSGGSFPPRLVVPTPSSLGSRSRLGPNSSRPPSQFVTGSQAGSRTSRASRGHSPAPSIPPSPPPRDSLTRPESPESEHDESAQLLRAERGNVRSGIGLLGRFSWFARGNGSNSSPAARTSRNSYPGWMSPPTEEGFLAEADSALEAGPSASDPPTLESRPPASHPGMVRLVPREQSDAPRPVSSVSGNTVYHDAPSQPATPRTTASTWLGFLGRASPASGPTPPVPQRPSPLSRPSTSTPVPVPSTPVTLPQPARTRGSSDSEVDPASRLARDEAQPPSPTHSDILDAPAPESLLDISSPALAPPSPAPALPPGLLRLPRTWNFGLLNELGDEPPAAEERWAHIRSTPDLSWGLRRFSLGRTVRISSPHEVTDSQVGSVHGGGTASPTTSDPRQDPISEGSSQVHRTGGSTENSRPSDSDLRQPAADQGPTGETTRHSVSMSGTGTSADTTTVSSHHPSTLVMTESGRFGFEFGGFGYVDSEYDDYETRATTISSNVSGDSSGREAVDLHGEAREDGQDVYVRDGGRFLPPMSAVGISNWGQHGDAGPGRA